MSSRNDKKLLSMADEKDRQLFDKMDKDTKRLRGFRVSLEERLRAKSITPPRRLQVVKTH